MVGKRTCVYYVHTKWKIPKFAHIDSYEFRFCISLVTWYGIFKLIHALNNLTILQRFVIKNVWKCTTTHYVKKLIWSNNCSARSDDWVGCWFLGYLFSFQMLVHNRKRWWSPAFKNGELLFAVGHCYPWSHACCWFLSWTE